MLVSVVECSLLVSGVEEVWVAVVFIFLIVVVVLGLFFLFFLVSV